LIILEADIADGDLGAVTQAIQNALRPPAPPTLKRIASSPAGQSAAAVAQADVEQDEDDIEEEDDVILMQATPKAKGPRKPAATPKAIDIDMHADPSFEAFAAGKDAESNHKKFMIAAVWLQEHRGVNRITANHIYTCYRSIGWSIGIPDFSQPLRDLKARDFLTTPEKGKYEVNHLGLDFVRKLGTANGTS
jgi:hypothetical protein